MLIKDILRKNNIKIKAIEKDRLIFYSSEDSEKALKALKTLPDYRVLMDKEKPEIINLKYIKQDIKKQKVSEETVSGDIGGAEPPVVYKKKEKENLFRRFLNQKSNG